jgi:hypothetical protein
MTCPTMRRMAWVAVFAAVFSAGAPARAQITEEPVAPYPDATLFARGLFVEAEGGAVIPVGPAHNSVGVGAALGARVGYDLLRFVAVQAHVLGSTHGIDAAEGPTTGQLLQLLQVTGELKLTLPLGAWSLSALGGAGRARFSSNVLAAAGLTDPGVRVSLIYGGALGVDYHSRSRHFSAGANAGFTKLERIATTGAVNATAYLRYTF